MKKLFRLMVLTLCAVCLLSALGSSAYALDPINVNEKSTITATLISGNTAIPGAEFSLYRVGDTSKWAEFTLCGGFKGYKGEINGFTSADEWDKAAAALTEYANNNKLAPMAKAKTGTTGSALFNWNIRPGLYLLVCGEVNYKNSIYSARPALVSVPSLNEKDDSWQYDVIVYVKPGVKPTPAPTPTTTPAPRPLPQTGQLWWPVPVLVCGGLFLVLIGVVKRRSSKDET